MKILTAVMLLILVLSSVHIAFAEDSDGDGVDDLWESRYFGNLSKRGIDDSDNDGKTNLEEYNANTNPSAKEPADFITISLMLVLASIFAILTFIVLAKLKKKEKHK